MEDKLTVHMRSTPMKPEDYQYPNATLTIITEHNIPCGCNYGLVSGWFGFTKICTVCNGTYSLGTHETTRVIGG